MSLVEALFEVGEHALNHDLGDTVVQVTVGKVPMVLVGGANGDDVDVLVQWMRSVHAAEARVGMFLLEAHGRLLSGREVRVTSAVPGMSLRAFGLAFGPEGSSVSLRELAWYSPGRAAA